MWILALIGGFGTELLISDNDLSKTLHFMGMITVTYIQYCVMVKRLQDFNKSGVFIIVPILVAVLLIFLVGFLVVHLYKDISATVDAWYFHSTPIWILVMAVASIIYFREFSKLKQSGADVKTIFSSLPPE